MVFGYIKESTPISVAIPFPTICMGSCIPKHKTIWPSTTTSTITPTECKWTGGATVNAEYNYWGHSTGPYHGSLNSEGEGNPADGDGTDLDFIPFLTSPVGTINLRPTAMLDVDKNNPNVGETVTFDASASTDDGNISYFFIDFGDGTNSCTTSSVVTHEYLSQGNYNATLVVMDDFGVTSLDGDRVYVDITVITEFPASLTLLFFMILALVAATALSGRVRH